MSIRLKTQNITNMYTPIELVTTNIGQVAYHGGGGGITDHGYLHGLGDNDHPQYLLSTRSTQFMPAGNSASYQLTANNSLSLDTGAAVSFLYTSNSSNLIALSNSTIYAVSNHTHSGLGGAASDHSHGSAYTVSTAGSDINYASNSSGITIGIPKYITTAYGAAIKGSGSYNQNTGTIQFSNSNGVSFGLGTDGVMTASIPAVGGAQTGISGIAGSGASTVTAGTIQFANANGISFGLNSNTMTAVYTVPGNTVFSNSNNVEFGLSGSTITALALFAQTTQTQNLFNLTLGGNNTAGTMAQVSSGTLTLYGGNNVTLSQSGNKISINASVGVSNSHNVTLGGNSTSAGAGYIEISSGTLTLAGGNNITLSQNGNAITLVGAAQGGVQTGISGIAGSNTTYVSGTVYLSAQNNITIGSYASSNSQYYRLSVGNYLTTAAQSDHTHGSNVSTASTSGSDIKFSSSSNGLTAGIPIYLTTAMQSVSSSVFAKTGFSSQSTSGTDIVGTLNTNGLNLGIPKFVTNTAAGAHTHGSLSLNLTNLTGTYSSASDGLTISMTAYPATSFVAASDTGNVYFGGGSNITWGSSVSSNSTSFMATAGGGSGGAGMALAFSGNTTGTTQTLGGGTVQFVGGNNITLSQAGSIITISAGASGGAADWATATLGSGTALQISTGATNTLHYPKYITTYSAGTGVGTGLSKTAADISFDSNGLSFDGRRYAGTGFNSSTISGANISGSLDSTNGLRLWVPNYLTTQTLPSNTVSFVDGGGITWGTSVGSATNITLVTATVIGGTGGGTSGSSYVFSNSNNVTFGVNGNTVTAAVPGVWPLCALGVSGTNAGYAQKFNGSMSFVNSNNVSFGLNTNGDVMTASASYPTGNIYFADSNGHSFSSSVNGVSTTIYIVT
jgi:hypothetical protein